MGVINRGRILLADGFKDLLDRYEHFLSAQGFEVISARNGHEAMTLALQHKPDVIVMELQLLGITGWDATQQLKRDERTNHIRVIVLTSRYFFGAAVDIIRAGCDALVYKPCRPEDLMTEIVRLLGIPQPGLQGSTAL